MGTDEYGQTTLLVKCKVKITDQCFTKEISFHSLFGSKQQHWKPKLEQITNVKLALELKETNRISLLDYRPENF
jgi:hypothetical protein